MPCWSTQSNEPSFGNMTPEKMELLRRALGALGYYIHRPGYAGFEQCELVSDNGTLRTSVRVENGTVILSGAANADLAEATRQLKKAYSEEVVSAALKKFGWQSSKAANGKIRATRRY